MKLVQVATEFHCLDFRDSGLTHLGGRRPRFASTSDTIPSAVYISSTRNSWLLLHIHGHYGASLSLLVSWSAQNTTMSTMSPYDSLPVSPLRIPSSFNFARDVVDYWAQKDPSQLALHWTDQSLNITKQLTYSHVSRQSHRIAKLLTSLGLKQGDTLILILPRIPEWWEIAIACLRAGIILCPCTTLLVDKDIEYRLQVSHAAGFIGDEAAVRKCQKVRPNCHSLRTVIKITSQPDRTPALGVKDFHAALSRISECETFPVPNDLVPASPALTFFTSGTTGPPKIVQHNQMSYPLAHALTGIHWLRLRPPPNQSVYWNLSEQGWAKAAWSFFATFNCGACLFVHDDRLPFNAKRTIEGLHKFPITTLCAPPTVYRQLVLDENLKLFSSDEGIPKALSHACGAGEPLNESVIRTWKDMTGGMEICDGYGQTESILVCANYPQEDGKVEIRYGSMGKPLPGVPLRVISNDGEGMPADQEGDIAIEIEEDKDRFFGIFEGYIDKSTGKLDRRVKSFPNNRRFYLTGDRARRDKDGYFWFVGRSDDVINSSGYRIGPFEVESTLKLHPSVVESAVVASPDPQREEVVKAFIVLTDEAAKTLKQGGESGREQLVLELQDFCKENAAPYKYPRKMEFVDAIFLPKTISGKIKRSELKKLEKEQYQKERSKL